MAYDKVVDSAFLEAGLTLVGDSIRAKGGTSAKLEFPNGMKAAVEAIDTSEDLDSVLTEQESIIDQIQAALEGKASVSITEDDLTPELLQSFDPDFIADNIAEGVDLFGLVGTLSGAKVASGTASTTTVSSKVTSITVTGLPFTPTNVWLARTAQTSINNYYTYVIKGTGYHNQGTQNISLGLNADGFTYTTSGGYKFNGSYYWVAWAS